MRALTPWTGMTSLRKEMDRVFERFLEPMWPEMPTLGEWEPKLDVTETKESVIVKAELPGVEQKDIVVSLQEGVLTIRGEKESQKEEKDKQYHRVERGRGSFTRTFQFATAIDASRATADLRDGILIVTCPKSPDQGTRRIRVS